MRGSSIFFLASMVALACGGESDDGGSGTGGSGGSSTGGSAGSGATGGSAGSGGSSGTGATGGSAGSGGSSTGGSAGSGGSTTGGSGGATGGTGGSVTGGTGGASTGGTGGAAAKPECTQASDCKVFEDCCSCEGVPSSANPSICKMACTTKKCAELGVSSTEVSCVAGRCVKGYECDSSKVVCLSMPPKCAAGEVAQVKGSCWTGKCVPAGECLGVASCSECDGSKYACVTNVAKPAPTRHCVDVPQICGGAATCGCFGPSVCTSPFTSCNDLSGVKGVTCGCPTC